VGPTRHYPGGALPMSLLTSANDGTMCPAAPLWRQARHGTRIPCQEAECERHQKPNPPWFTQVIEQSELPRVKKSTRIPA